MIIHDLKNQLHPPFPLISFVHDMKVFALARAEKTTIQKEYHFAPKLDSTHDQDHFCNSKETAYSNERKKEKTYRRAIETNKKMKNDTNGKHKNNHAQKQKILAKPIQPSKTYQDEPP